MHHIYWLSGDLLENTVRQLTKFIQSSLNEKSLDVTSIERTEKETELTEEGKYASRLSVQMLSEAVQAEV